ncbi:unnamed protein product [Closterium sp. NIES-64]|nr:unnamed protein product [Closterium sp. NIES-64]
MKPKRRAPQRVQRKPSTVASVGGGSCMRFLLLFLAAAVLFWVLSSRSEAIASSLNALSRRAKIAGGGDKPLVRDLLGTGAAGATSIDVFASDSLANEEPVPQISLSGTDGQGEEPDLAGTLDSEDLGAVSAAQNTQETPSERGKAVADAVEDTTRNEAARRSADDAPLVKSAGLRGDGLSTGDKKSDAISEKPRPAANVIVSVTQPAGVTKPATMKRKKRRVKAPLARWAPLNGKYPDLTIAKPKRKVLKVNIDKKNLQRVYLDATRFQENNPKKVDPPFEASRGPECPTFEYGYEGFPGIASCWRSPIEDVLRSPASLPANCANATDAGCMQEADKQPHEPCQVLLLLNMYVDVTGQGLNLPTHLPLPLPAVIPFLFLVTPTHQLLLLHNVYMSVEGQEFNATQPHLTPPSPPPPSSPGAAAAQCAHQGGRAGVLLLHNVLINGVGHVFNATSAPNPYFFPSPISPFSPRHPHQVLLLHNVYINVAGQVFNATHLFDHNACAADSPFHYTPGNTQVSSFPSLISLVDWFGWSARAYMLDLVPSIVTLDTVLALLKGEGVPVALGLRDRHVKNQMEQATGLGHWELVGVRLERMNPQILKEGELFFAERLILPLKQRCGRPSRAMWSYLRHRNLLPKPGLPIYRHEFKPTYRRRKGEDLSAGSDWIVVVAMRDEWKPLVQTLKLTQQLLKWLPQDRIVTYRDGSLPFGKRKELFNRARLLVAAHDNVLADMVFMPAGGAVVEIRPEEEADPTFHHLADACQLDYYLLFSDGRKADGKKGGKPKVKDPKVVHKLLEKIARRIRKV